MKCFKKLFGLTPACNEVRYEYGSTLTTYRRTEGNPDVWEEILDNWRFDTPVFNGLVYTDEIITQYHAAYIANDLFAEQREFSFWQVEEVR